MTPELRLRMQVADALLTFYDDNQDLTRGDLQGVADVMARDIIDQVREATQ